MRTALVLVVMLLAALLAASGSPAAAPRGAVMSADPCVPLARAVLDSFPPPGAVPRGLDWDADAGVLFHCDDDDAGGTVYSIDPDGTAALLFDVSAETGHRQAGATDLCLVHDDSLDVNYLYVVDYRGGKDTSDIVYQFMLDGTLVDEYPLMGIDPVCPGVMGITFDGEFFWLSCLLTSEIVKCDTEFAAIDTFSHPAGTGGGMDFDPETRRLYVTDFFEGDIYVTDRTLHVIDVFPAHPVAFQMVGVAIGRVERRRTVWTSCYNPNWRYIYEIDDEYYNSAVERLSWGMIKSLYR